MAISISDSQLTIDAFAALSGTLKAGGIFFLVVPTIDINNHNSLFLSRFYSLVEKMPAHTILSQSDTELEAAIITRQVAAISRKKHPFGCKTQEQFSAVKAIEKVVTGHRKRPLVLTADRGRGKSSALAIACAQLMKAHQDTEFDIRITAPDSQALAIFFHQLNISLPNAIQQANSYILGKAKLTFMAIEQLLKQPVNTNLLLVDEAAAIPVYLLEQLVGSYHRMVFSSTVHGYEGAGRGFTIKFQKILSRICPQWQSLHIKQPIRWRQGDPLEKLVFDTCLLNAELPSLSYTLKESDSILEQVNVAKPVFKVVLAKDLVKDEALLQQVFAVLVTAHYQTKPSDLQLLLDNPQIQLACLFASGQENADIIAVALLIKEGANNSVNDADVTAIKNSQRRLRNHFLPQSLLSHCGFELAFDYRYLRIMRIAVHPQLQQQGIGSYFLEQIQLLATKQAVDFVGTSFGVNPTLLSFWLKAGFSTSRIGFTKDKASGEHSALLIRAINAKARLQQQKLKQEFYRSFDYLLLEEYQTLSTPLVRLLLSQQEKKYLVELSEIDIANVQAFSTGERLYSSCAYSLYLWLKHDLLTYTHSKNQESEKESLILISRLIQKHSGADVCQQYALTGKKMLNQRIRDYVCSRLKQANN